MANSGFTRREFTLALAGSAALAADRPLVANGVGVSEDKANAKQPPSTSKKDSDDGTPATKEPDDGTPREPPSEAAYLLGLIMRRYADNRLDEVAVSGIVQDIYGDLARSRVLSSLPLKNSDEPGFVFKAWRAD